MLQASVHMMRAVDAQAFASAPSLFIREKRITASLTKVHHSNLYSDGISKTHNDHRNNFKLTKSGFKK